MLALPTSLPSLVADIVIFIGAVLLLIDGMDFAAANVAAPQIIKALGTDRAAMGQVFAYGNFGILCGSLLFGFIGIEITSRSPSIVK